MGADNPKFKEIAGQDLDEVIQRSNQDFQFYQLCCDQELDNYWNLILNDLSQDLPDVFPSSSNEQEDLPPLSPTSNFTAFQLVCSIHYFNLAYDHYCENKDKPFTEEDINNLIISLDNGCFTSILLLIQHYLRQLSDNSKIDESFKKIEFLLEHCAANYLSPGNIMASLIYLKLANLTNNIHNPNISHQYNLLAYKHLILAEKQLENSEQHIINAFRNRSLINILNDYGSLEINNFNQARQLFINQHRLLEHEQREIETENFLKSETLHN